MLAPLLKPLLKNTNELVDFITIQVALKSSRVNGSNYLSNSLVAKMTCLAQTEYLLNIKKWVSVISSM